MNLEVRSLTPPPGTIFCEGVEVTHLQRTPDHEAYYISRAGATTLLIPRRDLDIRLEVR